MTISNQKGNLVSGHLAGRDVLVTNNTFNTEAAKGYVALLYERLRLETTQTGSALADSFVVPEEPLKPA